MLKDASIHLTVNNIFCECIKFLSVESLMDTIYNIFILRTDKTGMKYQRWEIFNMIGYERRVNILEEFPWDLAMNVNEQEWMIPLISFKIHNPRMGIQSPYSIYSSDSSIA